MIECILPQFERHPQELAVIGRLVAGYGELEFTLATCAVVYTGDIAMGYRLIFRFRSESTRIQIADTIIRGHANKIGLGPFYEHCLGALRYCLKIRNQYAHCHWPKPENGILGFHELESSFVGPNLKPTDFKPIDLDLLNAQEAYFCYTRDCLIYLRSETIFRISQKPHSLSKPQLMQRPNLHNPL